MLKPAPFGITLKIRRICSSTDPGLTIGGGESSAAAVNGAYRPGRFSSSRDSKKERRFQMLKKIALLALVFVFALSFSMVDAQTTAGTQPGKQTTESRLDKSDQRFMEQAARDGIAEVELGKLAAAKGMDEHVKQMGQKLADDHTKANDRLMKLAQSKDVTLPSGLDKSGQDKIGRLSKLSGKDFDKAFMKEVEKDHKKDISEFKKEAKDGKDPDIKSFASEMIPSLESHLNMARGMTNKSASAKPY
jgi:putative membrane protein